MLTRGHRPEYPIDPDESAYRQRLIAEARRRTAVRYARTARLKRQEATTYDPMAEFGPPSLSYRPQPRHLEVEAALRLGYRHCLLVGGSRCLSGDAVIDGQELTIAELAEIGRPIDVVTTRGVLRVDAPFLTGRERLVSVELASGRTVRVTRDHRFWDGRRWVRAGDLCAGALVAVASGLPSGRQRPSWLGRPQSTSGRVREEFLEGGRRSSRIVLGFLDHCSEYFRRCGLLPRQVLAGVRVCCALPFDGRRPLQSLSSFRLGTGPGAGSHRWDHPGGSSRTGSLSAPSSPPSRLGGSPSSEEPEHTLGRVSWRTSGWSLGLGLARRLSRWPSSLRRSTLGLVDDARYQFCRVAGVSYDFPRAGGYVLDSVLRVTETAEAVQHYTVFVPTAEHYFAAGVLHHNSGKTFIFCKRVIERTLDAPGSDHLIVRFRANAARMSIWLGTLPMVRRLCFPGLAWEEHSMDGYIRLPNGSRIWVGGLDEKERVEKILGTDFATIYPNEGSQIPYSSILILRTRLAQVAYRRDGTVLPQQEFADLNPVGKAHWSHREWIQGVSPESRRPIPNFERDYYHAFLQPQDNAANLTREYLESLANAPERHRRRFYEGQYVDDVAGALWTMEALDHARVAPADVPSTLDRVTIAVDPSGTDGDEDERSDDVGIVVVGRHGTGERSTGYLIDDLTCNEPPLEWGRRVVMAYYDYRADRIVAEANFGGAMVAAVIDAAARSLGRVLPPVVLVTASRGKAQRAEPVSVLMGHPRNGEWVGDRMRHAGDFPLLEEELLAFSVHGYTGPKSPNRADAYCWGVTDVMLGEQVGNQWGSDQLEVVH